MRINELLIENKEQLNEGPLGALGSMAGKAVGGLAKGIGAVAGGVVGAGRALKKGYQTGKAVVGDDPDPNAGAPGYEEPAAKAAAPAGGGQAAASAGSGQAAASAGSGQAAAPPASGAQPAAAPAAKPAAAPPASGAQPAAAPAAKPAAGAAAQPAAADVAAAGKPGSPYKAAQDAVAKLDKRGKQNLLKLLQKEFPQAAPAAEKPAAGAPAAPAAGAAAQPAAEKPAAAATPAAEPAAPAQAAPAATQQAAPTAPTAQPAATQQTAADADAGKPGFMQSKIKGRRPAAKPSQAEIDADRDRIMGVTSDSIIRTGNKLAETLASRVEHHKRKMFEASIAKGEFRVFK